MDAYVFARGATREAIDALAARVDDAGAVRVVMPLAGADALYVAVAGDDAESLQGELDEIRSVPGLVGVRVYLATQASSGETAQIDTASSQWDGATPTWRAVDEAVGFALLTCQPGSTTTVYVQAGSVEYVIGLAVVSGATPTVLAEITGSSAQSLQAPFDALGTLVGVTSSATSIGFASTATGVRRIGS